MSRDPVVDFAALMEERSSSVSEDSFSQAEDEDSRDTVAPDAANVPDIHHGPVIQAIQVCLLWRVVRATTVKRWSPSSPGIIRLASTSGSISALFFALARLRVSIAVLAEEQKWRGGAQSKRRASPQYVKGSFVASSFEDGMHDLPCGPTPTLSQVHVLAV
ncbi:hypothetical protein DdX_11898 [Ditylenchus destructor]|uniref:Uncharacterized protein n=1 Tax=Ditylenchus destructor TaxID=166010 RepID=A0AAD4MWR6_9BILA|nr:hypothetical protein DdX_11898 [Ditylenchus destructor]